MGTSSCIVGLVTVTVLCLASFATAASPPYKCFSYLASSNATIEPTGDIIRQVGDSYEAYCLFDSNYVNASDVSFGYRSGDKFNKFPHQVVNASAIKINVKTESPENYDLWCALREKYHLCSRIVKVGYPPQDVQNFTCLSKNWSNLNCSWTVPYNPVKVLYSVTYVIPGFREQSECPRKTHYETSCFWDKNLFDLNVKDEIVMHFNATNKLKEDGVIFEYVVNIPESVLPDPVEKLTALVDGSHNVTLTWILPHPMDTFGRVLCEAAYRQRLDGDVLEDVPWKVVDSWKVEPDRWSPGETFNRTINNLLPYIQYDFRVRIHTGFGGVRPHMWSEAAILTKRTYPSNPTVAPKTTSGTFEVEETLSYRDIYILWQIVDPLYYNGRNFHYNISAYDDKSNRLIAKDSAEVDIKESYAKFSNMEKDLTYRFEIIPVNDEGPPLNANVRAIVMVPGKAELLTQPTFFKVIAYSEANKTVYSMKWRVDDAEAQGVETVTLYWCKKIKYEERCQDKLEWEIIEDPGLNVKNITHLDETALYMFGISVNSAHSSSGIKWLTCIASFGNHPPPLEHFAVSEVTSTEVYLEWSLDCKAKAAEPIGFNISYCAVAGDAQKCPVDAEKSYESINDETALQHVVRNLHPYTKYIFNIAILTQIGLSKWSKSVHVETEPDKPSGPPQDFRVIESGQSWILLSWKLPMSSERNGKITKYKLSWESSYGPKEESVSASSSSEITEYKVTELDPFTKYNFKVTACTEIKYTDVLCGNYSSEAGSRTKIGAPSKVDDISQVDEYVKWEHECSNGPACFYQLLYTVNSTEHIHETEENAASINIRELNITCTKKEKDITIKLRAVTYNESEQKLFGPWKEESVTCYLTGSYSPDHVPRTTEKIQIILVHLPQNNQYNTVINLLKIPVTGSSLLSYMNRNKDFKVSGDQRGHNTGRVTMGSQKFESEEKNVNAKGEDHNGENYASNTNIGRERSKKHSGVMELNVSSNSHLAGSSIRYLTKQEKDLAHDHDSEVDTLILNAEPKEMNLEMRNVSSPPSNTYIQLRHNEYTKPSTYPFPNKITHKLTHKLSCPLLNLMKSPGSEVRINATDAKFEFSIKGTGSPYSIMKALYQHSAQFSKPDRALAGSDEFVPNSGRIFVSHQSVSEGDIRTTKRDERNVLSSSGRPLSIQQTPAVLQERRESEQLLELIKSEPLIEKDNFTNIVLSVSENKTVADSDTLEFNVSKVIEAKEEPANLQVINQENITREGLENRSLPILEKESSVILTEIPPEDTPVMELVGVTSDGNLLNILNGSLKVQLQDDSPENERDLTWPAEQPQYGSSLIYRIIGSFNGNIHEISHKMSKQMREDIPLVTSLGDDHVQFSRRQSQRGSGLTSDEFQRVSAADSSYSDVQEKTVNKAENMNLKPSCPFVDLIKSKGVNVQLVSPGDGKIEFSIKGNGNFYDLLETLYDPESKSHSMKRINGNDEVPVMERIQDITFDKSLPQMLYQTPGDGRELNQKHFEIPSFVDITTEQSLEHHSQPDLSYTASSTDLEVPVTSGSSNLLSASQSLLPSGLVSETSTEHSEVTKYA